MNVQAIVVSQFNAALEMLKGAVEKCPDALWDSGDDKTKFWAVAYHALFYTHLYLQDSEKVFKTWEKHREAYEFGATPAEGGAPVVCPKQTVLEYLAFCRAQVTARVPQLDLEADSGFFWLPFSRLELHLYTIRHVQQHAGELMERLGSRAAIDVDWVGSMPG